MSPDAVTLEYDDVASLAAQLVRIPSENPPGEEADCAAFIHRWFDDRGVDAVLVEDPDPDRPQVAARVGSGDPTLVLNGHVDVVPAGDHEAWTDDPYGGTVADGRLYGRGSADMKTGLAIAMLLCHRYASTGTLTDDSRAPPAGTLVFHAAMGEETGEPGTRTLLERGYGGDHGIVLEPTSFRVGTSSKGLAVYEVRIVGSATHASHPEEGANPIAAAGRVLAAIDAYDEELRARGSGLCGAARASATEIESGVGSNYGVIPGEARLVLDRRIVPGEALTDVDAEVRDRLEAVADETGLAVESERVQHYASAEIPVDDPLARRLRDRSREEADAPAEPWGLEAATDMRNFVEDADTPAIIWGPGSLGQAHTVDESIPIAEAELGYRLLAEVAAEYLAGEIE